MENTARGVATIRKEARGGSRPARISVVSRLLNHFVSHEIGRHETFVTQCVSACVGRAPRKIGKPSSRSRRRHTRLALARPRFPSFHGEAEELRLPQAEVLRPADQAQVGGANRSRRRRRWTRRRARRRSRRSGRRRRSRSSSRTAGRARRAEPGEPGLPEEPSEGARRVPRPASRVDERRRPPALSGPARLFLRWRRRRSTTRAKYLPPPPSLPAPLPPRPDPSTLPLPPVRRRRTSRGQARRPAGAAAAT